jgi:hypothetical protein
MMRIKAGGYSKWKRGRLDVIQNSFVGKNGIETERPGRARLLRLHLCGGVAGVQELVKVTGYLCPEAAVT